MGVTPYLENGAVKYFLITKTYSAKMNACFLINQWIGIVGFSNC